MLIELPLPSFGEVAWLKVFEDNIKPRFDFAVYSVGCEGKELE